MVILQNKSTQNLQLFSLNVNGSSSGIIELQNRWLGFYSFPDSPKLLSFYVDGSVQKAFGRRCGLEGIELAYWILRSIRKQLWQTKTLADSSFRMFWFWIKNPVENFSQRTWLNQECFKVQRYQISCLHVKRDIAQCPLSIEHFDTLNFVGRHDVRYI